MLRNCLEADTAIHGESDVRTARTSLSLAFALKQLGQLRESERLHRRALSDLEAAAAAAAAAGVGSGGGGGGSRSTEADILVAMNNLAEVLRDLRQFKEAVRVSRRALGITRASFGEDHPDTLIAMNNLAMMLKTAESRDDEVLELCQQSLATADEILGKTHQLTLMFVDNLVMVLKDLGRLCEADKLLQRCLS